MDNKHKKHITNNLTPTELQATLTSVENMIKSLKPKQQHIMSEWLMTWCMYLSFEDSFIPGRLKYYKRGDIVLVHFGFNTGSELGGAHYAVVVEKNNNNASSTITVVPLSSLADGKTEKDLHDSEVYLGKVLPGSDKMSYAMPLQIRTVSKIRIIKPKNTSDHQYTLTSEQLAEIDDRIIRLFTK